jgi:TRAP-type uncharacterized transport system substrate-binding protein
MSFNQGSIEKNVRYIANIYPDFLKTENRKRAIVYYLTNFEGVTFPLTEEAFFTTISQESITRALRKVAEEKGIKSRDRDWET